MAKHVIIVIYLHSKEMYDLCSQAKWEENESSKKQMFCQEVLTDHMGRIATI